MCVKDCGLYNENIDMIILFACLVAWLDSSSVEILKKIGTIFKKHGMNTSIAVPGKFFSIMAVL